MQKIINFRAFLMIFIGAVIGVVFSLNILQKSLSFFIISLILTITLLLFVIITSCLKIKKFAFVNKFLICLLIGFVVFLGLGVLNFKTFNRNLVEKQNVEISARVNLVNEKNGYYYIILENCLINNNEKVNGKVAFTLYCEDDILQINIGDNVKFVASLVVNSILKDGKFNSYYYKNDLKYYCYANSDDITINAGTLKFDEICREKVKKMLFENLSYNNAAISYASIFGDKTMLDNSIKEAFSISGTSHLLCVSGLHVGFLATLIYLFLNLCKVKKKYSFLILTLILCLYAYLCGFSPSVVRASIMSIIFAFSDAYGKVKYDSLSSLGLAGIAIMLIKPFYIFDLGFQLSFAACFGIILLNPIFTKFFKRINFENKISSAFCVSLSAQIGTFPILYHNFDKLSFVSLIANVVIVPFFSLVFMFSIVFVLLNLILPLGFLFRVIDISFNVIVFLTKSFGAVEECIFSAYTSSFITNFMFYLTIIILSNFVNLKLKIKAFTSLVCLFICLVSFSLLFYPQTFKMNLIINTSSENFTIITNSLDQKILINCGKIDKNDAEILKNDTFNNKIFNIDALILANYNQNMQQDVCDICERYNIKLVYIPSQQDEETNKYLFNNLSKTKIVVTSEEYVSYSNFTFMLYQKYNLVYLNVLDRDMSVSMVLSNSLNKKVASFLVEYNIDANYYKTKIVNVKYAGALERFDNILCYKTNCNQINVFNINNLCDKIVMGEKLNYAF